MSGTNSLMVPIRIPCSQLRCGTITTTRRLGYLVQLMQLKHGTALSMLLLAVTVQIFGNLSAQNKNFSEGVKICI